MSEMTTAAAIGLTELPAREAVNHTRRLVVWNDQLNVGRIFILVGYCPDTLPYFLGLIADALKTFPGLNLQECLFGKVHKSRWADGFTLMSAPIAGPKRVIEGYDERTWENIDIHY